jgi:hypothetical protein
MLVAGEGVYRELGVGPLAFLPVGGYDAVLFFMKPHAEDFP